MLDSFLRLVQGAEAEIVEKKSRFIAQIESVSSEEEANAFIERIKKKHYDARHNCFAYLVGGEKPLFRFSDDGEPQGTAGKPIMEVINGSGIHNICIVVTRYFGGTLLGTGGLVRAYTAAAKEALLLCETKVMKRVCPVEITASYADLPKIQYILSSMDANLINQKFEDVVTLYVEIPSEKCEQATCSVTEITGGKAQIHMYDEIFA